MTLPEPTLSIRLLWPFVRALGNDPRGATLLEGLKLRGDDLVFDQRISAAAAMTALNVAVEMTGDPALGLRAGKLTDQGTFGILEHGFAVAATLRDAIEFFIRHFQVMSEASEAWLATEGERTVFWYAPIIPHPPAGNDLLVSAAIDLVQRHCAPDLRPQEVWLIHDKPSYADLYQALWGVPVRFGMHANAIVFDSAWLDHAMPAANANMAIVFERKAQQIASGLTHGATMGRRVRERLIAGLADGAVEMSKVARALKVSTATLRRRLDEEGVAFSAILDDVRKDAAQRYLLGSDLTVTEIADRLGFSHVRAFARAFRRWTGKTPSDFRQHDT